MLYTANYNFKKPEGTEQAKITDINYNFDNVDSLLKTNQTNITNLISGDLVAGNASLLGGQNGAYYLNWANITNKPGPVVVHAGDVLYDGGSWGLLETIDDVLESSFYSLDTLSINVAETTQQVQLHLAGEDYAWGQDMTVKQVINALENKKNIRAQRFVIGTSTAEWTEKDCDYLCDGTNDQIEINNAINALPTTGGEIVILDGTYNITAKINVTKNNVSIRGNGNATILKRMYNNSTSEGIITLTSVSGCKIADLQVDGNKTSYSNNNNYGIFLEFTSNNTITGNTYNNNNYGIYSYGSSSNTITSNTCNNNSNYGIYLYNSSNSNTVTGNACNDNNNTGIYLVYSSNNNTVTGNTCYNNNFGSGIRLSESSNNTVTGNTCNNSYYGTGINISNSNDNTIISNICNNNKEKGINLEGSSNNTVTGNTCNNNNASGILLEDSSNNTVTGNTCIRGTGLTTDYAYSHDTIRLNYTDNNYNLISNNNCMGKAITVGGGTGNTLVNNKFDDSDDIQALKISKANLDSLNLIGIPTAPTAIAETNTTQIATTAFVATALENANNFTQINVGEWKIQQDEISKSLKFIYG